MFCKSLLKYKGVRQETAIAEALKYQKYEVRGVRRYLLFHRGAYSKFQRKSLRHPSRLHQVNTSEVDKIMALHTQRCLLPFFFF